VPAAVRSRADACPGVFAPHDAADGALARIRLPGGVVDAAALRVLAGCAEELGDGRVHLTSRGNLQSRGLSRSPVLAARLADAGLLPSATHERVRNVLASPLSGIVGGLADVRGLAAALDRGLCARPELAELPGRFLFALDDGRGDVAAEDPDLCWRAPGALLVAGVETGLVVAASDAVAVLLDAAEAFLALRAADGGTAWRAAELAEAPARIAAALVDAHGAGLRTSQHGGFAAVGVQQSHHAALADTPSAARPGPVRRADGGTALVVAPLLGELTADQLRLLADTGPTAVVTPWRTLVLPAPRLAAAELAAAGLVVEPGPAADVSACAGRPGCAKALADVRADTLAAIGRLPAGRVHVSGCARRCGAPRGRHVDAVALVDGGYLIDGIARAELG
jgi:precorrin-3B synthase